MKKPLENSGGFFILPALRVVQQTLRNLRVLCVSAVISE